MGIINRKEGVERIDTNILVRLIVNDEPKQVKRAKKLFSHKDKLCVFEDAAMMEVVYVLSGKLYQQKREQIASNIKDIMRIENLVCNKGLIEDSLNLYVSHPKLSFVDCYLAAITKTTQETPLWTFDHKLASQCTVAKEL